MVMGGVGRGSAGRGDLTPHLGVNGSDARHESAVDEVLLAAPRSGTRGGRGRALAAGRRGAAPGAAASGPRLGLRGPPDEYGKAVFEKTGKSIFVWL